MIPKLVHITYHDKDKIPEEVHIAHQKYLSDFTIRFYDDADADVFLRENFQAVVVERFHSLKKGAHKADLLRYCLLYIFGGVYCDIKTEFTQALLPLISLITSTKPTIYLVNSTYPSIYNGFIATPPNQILFMRLVQYILQIPDATLAKDYLLFVKHLYTEVRADVGAELAIGFNTGNRNDYYLYKETITRKVKDCPGGLDRYWVCSWITDEHTQRVIKTRYASYPWHQRENQNTVNWLLSIAGTFFVVAIAAAFIPPIQKIVVIFLFGVSVCFLSIGVYLRMLP